MTDSSNNENGRRLLHDPLTRIAVIYFLRDIDRFLALSPEEIQTICREASVDEEGFKNVCRVLIGCAARRDQVN